MATTISGDGVITLGGTSTTQGEIRLYEDTDNGTNYVSLQAPAAISSNTTFTLPNNAGQAGQALVSDGAGGLSFAGAGFNGATTTTTATNITLTSSSSQYQKITITAADKTVTLPDATTLTTEGGPVFIIENAGAQTFNILNADGGVIFLALGHRAVVQLSLIDNSTSAGVWSAQSYNTSEVAYGLQASTAYNTGLGFTEMFSAINIALDYWGTIGLDSETVVFYAVDNTPSGTNQRMTFRARVAKLVAGVWTLGIEYSYLAVNTNRSSTYTNQSTSYNGIRINSTTGVLYGSEAGNNASSTWYVAKRLVAFTVSGTVVTFGTAVSATIPEPSNPSSFGGVIANSNGNIYPLNESEGSFAIVYNSTVSTTASSYTNDAYTGVMRAKYATVSGTTITVNGTNYDLASSTGNCVNGSAVVAEDKLLFQLNDNGFTTYKKLVVLSNSAGTLSWGTPVDNTEYAKSDTPWNGIEYSVAPDSSQVAFYDSTAGYTGFATVSGTTPTVAGNYTATPRWPNYRLVSSGGPFLDGRIYTGRGIEIAYILSPVTFGTYGYGRLENAVYYPTCLGTPFSAAYYFVIGTDSAGDMIFYRATLP